MSSLFATTIANAKPHDRDYKLADAAGLYLLVRPSGRKLWRVNYRFLGKYRTLSFGAWPDVGWSFVSGIVSLVRLVTG